MTNIDRGTMLELFSLLGIKPGESPLLPTEEQRARANRAFAERPLTVQRIKDDARIALSHASLAGTAMGLGNADSAARHAGHAFAYYEALVADGCARIEGAEGVPLMAHGLAEACQAVGILHEAVAHAKRHLARWDKL
ncbi:hypothetical protein DMC47_01125 [Nostoc sp. 3335mG]|nr:hypothetical protein DMC47_01125 [Nostoc sp. 3335mG]